MTWTWTSTGGVTYTNVVMTGFSCICTVPFKQSKWTQKVWKRFLELNRVYGVIHVTYFCMHSLKYEATYIYLWHIKLILKTYFRRHSCRWVLDWKHLTCEIAYPADKNTAQCRKTQINLLRFASLCIALLCIAFLCIALHSIALHCLAMHWMALHCFAL